MDGASEVLVVTGQQIGAGWTPALSVVKALAALAVARRHGGRAVFWMADEDHDHLEVSATVAFEGERIHRTRVPLSAPGGTATGWIPWTEAAQARAEALWGPLPRPAEPTLRGHFLALGRPLWDRGLVPFSPTEPARREALQATLVRWRALDLETRLLAAAARLQEAGEALPLDPAQQAAWFSLDPRTGHRVRLERGEPCPPGCWLSPGAVLRPLMQSLLLPVTHAVLGPAERAYWRLTEPLWDLVGLAAPRIVARPTVYVVPRGLRLDAAGLEALRMGRWAAFHPDAGEGEALLPSGLLADPVLPEAWGPEVAGRFERELARTRHRLLRLDRRLERDRARAALGMDPERLRQRLFPLGRPMERILAGAPWLGDAPLLDRMLDTLGADAPLHILEAP